MAADEIATYTIEWKRDAGDPIGGCTTVTSSKHSHNYGFTVKANYTVRIWVTDKNGVSSKPSEWVTYVLR